MLKKLLMSIINHIRFRIMVNDMVCVVETYAKKLTQGERFNPTYSDLLIFSDYRIAIFKTLFSGTSGKRKENHIHSAMGQMVLLIMARDMIFSTQSPVKFGKRKYKRELRKVLVKLFSKHTGTGLLNYGTQSYLVDTYISSTRASDHSRMNDDFTIIYNLFNLLNYMGFHLHDIYEYTVGALVIGFDETLIPSSAMNLTDEEVEKLEDYLWETVVINCATAKEYIKRCRK